MFIHFIALRSLLVVFSALGPWFVHSVDRLVLLTPCYAVASSSVAIFSHSMYVDNNSSHNLFVEALLFSCP